MTNNKCISTVYTSCFISCADICFQCITLNENNCLWCMVQCAIIFYHSLSAVSFVCGCMIYMDQLNFFFITMWHIFHKYWEYSGNFLNRAITFFPHLFLSKTVYYPLKMYKENICYTYKILYFLSMQLCH